MAGQGRPHRSPRVLRTFTGRLLLAAWCIMPTLLAVRAAWGQQLVRPDTELPSTMRLRITFGGGSPRVWRGSISLSDGEFTRPELLGLEPDEPGSMAVGVRVIQIRQPSPRSYDGLDVSVRAPLHARLRIRLDAADEAGGGRGFDFLLSDLITGVHPGGDAAAGQLDDAGNRLVLSRSPGDSLRIAYDRPSLIFKPGETFRFNIEPHLLGLPPDTQLRMKLRVVSRLTGEEKFIREQDVRVDAEGNLAAWGPHEFTIPPGDGVYNLNVTLEKPSRFHALGAANPLTTSTPEVQRKLQFVALAADAPLPLDPPHEALVDEFDPVTTSWADRVAQWPVLKRLPRMRQGRLANGEVRVARHLGKQWAELAPDAWQAHPLSIDALGEPYVLEVEYPDNVPQTLGVSIVQPNALGNVSPLGYDSALEVAAPPVGVAAAVGRHRLVFWPRSKTPVLLLTSHDPDRPAVYGRVRIFRFSHRLMARRPRKANVPERLIAAWLDKPLAAEMFCANEAADTLTGRSLDDWRTFYEAGTRLTQHLHFAGYNAAVLPALCEGSTLYPSDLLQPTPKYDTGVYLSDGQDPSRKDALELLFRQFDREGLTLLPSLQFNTPLPELEQLRLGDPRERVGLELVDHNGRTWMDRYRPTGGLAPYYNPLDDRVQAAMTRVVDELARRYGHHPSFGGVVVQLSPESYAMLPGANWNFDDRTFGRFSKATASGEPGGKLRDRFEARAKWCATDGRDKWLAWRADEMSALYRGMSAAVRAHKGDAQLILAGSEMLNADPLRTAIRPTLTAKPNAAQQIGRALLELGLDTKRLQAEKSITLVAPYPALPRDDATAGPDAANDNADESTLSELHKQLAAGGALLYRPPVTRRLASFDAVSPFGKANTYTWLAAQVAESGDAARRRWLECLTRTDHTIIMDGGWMIARGQEDGQLDLLTALRHLPRTPLKGNVSTPATEPIIARTHKIDGRTVAYVMNPSPWPVQARLYAKSTLPSTVAPLVGGTSVPPVDDRSRWTVNLAPYDLVAAEFSQPDVELIVENVVLPADVGPALAQKLTDVRRRAAALKGAPPRTETINAGFEEVGENEGEIPGWLFLKQDGVEVTTVDGGHRNSLRAMKVVSRGPQVWVRSQPIPAPRTGRIAVWARLRTPTPDRQPNLRLAIEARRGRQPYYRFANVGANVAAAPLADGWSPFILQIDDLPREGLEEFRIGFDLMGPGEVWIDDVQVYDLSFTEQEQFQISRLIAAADFHLRESNLAAAAAVLDGYWPKFLGEHVDPSQAEIADTPRPIPLPPPPENTPPPRQSWRDWFRDQLWY